MVAQLLIQPWSSQSQIGKTADETLVAAPTAPIRALLILPDDEEIALSRVAVAAVSRGRSLLRLKRLPPSVEVLLSALTLLGIQSQWEQQAGELTIFGAGLDRFEAPTVPLDVRGELGVAGLLLGLCVSRPLQVELWVDELVCELLVPLLAEAHAIVVSPLPVEHADARSRCVRLVRRDAGEGRADGVECRELGLYSWVKQAILLAGLRAGTPTVVDEQLATADHLERALLRAKAPLDGHGSCIVLHPPRDADALAPQIYDRIGSADHVLPLLCAALAAQSGELVLRDVALNPIRIHMLPLLRSIGLGARVISEGDRQGEPYGRIALSWGGASGVAAVNSRELTVSGESAIRLGDGLIYLTAIAARSSANWQFLDFVPQKRGGDRRIEKRVVGLLRSAGVQVVDLTGGFKVQGVAGPLRSLQITSGGDARLVLLATALALRAGGPSTIDDVECLRDGFPKWVGTMTALGAQIEVKYEK